VLWIILYAGVLKDQGLPWQLASLMPEMFHITLEVCQYVLLLLLLLVVDCGGDAPSGWHTLREA
jgi:hypothetical protein